jgi:hypothetical protein
MVEVGGSNPPGPTKRQNPRHRRGFFVCGVRLDETGDCGSTKCDLRSILVARAKRRRPEGVRAREASALETIRRSQSPAIATLIESINEPANSRKITSVFDATL